MPTLEDYKRAKTMFSLVNLRHDLSEKGVKTVDLPSLAFHPIQYDFETLMFRTHWTSGPQGIVLNGIMTKDYLSLQHIHPAPDQKLDEKLNLLESLEFSDFLPESALMNNRSTLSIVLECDQTLWNYRESEKSSTSTVTADDIAEIIRRFISEASVNPLASGKTEELKRHACKLLVAVHRVQRTMNGQAKSYDGSVACERIRRAFFERSSE